MSRWLRLQALQRDGVQSMVERFEQSVLRNLIAALPIGDQLRDIAGPHHRSNRCNESKNYIVGFNIDITSVAVRPSRNLFPAPEYTIMKANGVEDEQIMSAVQKGDVAKLELLFDRHHRGLYHYFLHLTSNPAGSEDLVQEVFFRMLKYRHTYQPGTAVRPWMYQIGRNALADQAGKNKGQVALPESAAEIRSPEASPDRQAQANQEAALLKRALSAMPPEKREVIVMSRFLELKYEEIANVLNVEVGTVKVRVHRALRELGNRFFELRGERASS
jgi:RNA polymerase sigma factor (sigma-70 family)